MSVHKKEKKENLEEVLQIQCLKQVGKAYKTNDKIFFRKKFQLGQFTLQLHTSMQYFNQSIPIIFSGQKTPGLTKNAYHPISIYEKNDYRTISHYFIDQKNTKKIA